MRRTGLRARLAGGAAIAAVLLASGAVAGCSATAAPASTTVRSVSGLGPITFATGTVGSGYVPGLIRKWNAAHPCKKRMSAADPCQQVTVLYLPKDSDEQYAQLVENLQAKSDVYDVMNLDVVWTAEFASNGWITPVSDKKVPLSSFLPPAVDTAMYDGKLYAVPFTSNAGLLYYRKDLVKTPPRTWAQLAYDARTIAPAHHMGGYAGQFEDYEGLTVNFAEAVQSAGGSILSSRGTANLDTPQAHEALSFLVSGFRQGWIPAASLGYDEDASRDAFVAGHLLFLRNWPYMYGYASKTGPGRVVAGKFGVTTLPGPNGPGSSTLGGANLAVSAYSQHPETALAFIRFMTSESSQRQVLINASQPPVWTRLYNDQALIRRYPYLPVLKRAILAARPRPKIPSYSQLSLAISLAIHRALAQQVPVNQTLAALNGELNQIVKNG
jgi:multiple sugar transport system substrate-binding protein